jgi:hypothetical protein
MGSKSRASARRLDDDDGDVESAQLSGHLLGRSLVSAAAGQWQSRIDMII